MSVRPKIASEFQQVAKEQDRTLAPITDEMKLVESGLDSLSFAIIVARLEDSLGDRSVQHHGRGGVSRHVRRLRQVVRTLCQVTGVALGVDHRVRGARRTPARPSRRNPSR